MTPRRRLLLAPVVLAVLVGSMVALRPSGGPASGPVAGPFEAGSTTEPSEVGAYRPSLLPAVTAPTASAIGSAVSTRNDPPPVSTRSTGGRTGIAPGGEFLWHGTARLNSDLKTMRASGARWVRLDFDWSATEPSPGTYDFSRLDRGVRLARANGLKVLALVTYTPAWARRPATSGTNRSPPKDTADLARFTEKLGGRYATTVGAWEIWNEPNLATYWQPRPQPADYAAVLSAASRGLRRGGARTPVLTGGLAPASTDDRQIAPERFLAEIYRAGAGSHFDGVAIHPYSYPSLPTAPRTGHWNTFRRLPLIRKEMLRHGDAEKQVWLTEFGAPTGTGEGAVSPRRQADILVDGFRQARRWSWIGMVFTYSLRDLGTDPADREQNFGLLSADGRAKPAYRALADQASRPWP